jgi:hypothetical protein
MDQGKRVVGLHHPARGGRIPAGLNLKQSIRLNKEFTSALSLTLVPSSPA